MKALLAVAAVVGLFAAPAYAACTYPKSPDKIPDGNSATLEEMLAAKKQVDVYRKEIEGDTDSPGYLGCIKKEYEDVLAKDAAADAKSKMTDAQKKDLEKREVQKNNAAVDELQQVANRLNEQIRLFKAKSAPKT